MHTNELALALALALALTPPPGWCLAASFVSPISTVYPLLTRNANSSGKSSGVMYEDEDDDEDASA